MRTVSLGRCWIPPFCSYEKKNQTRAVLSALQWFPGAMLAILAKEGSGHSFLYGLLNIEADPCEICDCYPPVMKHNGKSANLFDDFPRL